MAERSRPPLPSAVQPPPPPGAPRRGTAAAAATNGTGAASTSRNLFKGHFTRRPTTAAAGNGAGVGAMASATGAAGGGGGGVAAGSAMSRSRTGSTTTTSSGSANSAETVRLPLSESVVGIDHGAIISEPLEIVVRDKHGEIEMGELPMLVLDDADEGFMHDQEETKRERQRLAEAIKQHQLDHSVMGGHPEELIEAVRRSLKFKVAALEEDQWMYESGDPLLRR